MNKPKSCAVGERFGKLVVIEILPNGYRHVRCDCGRELDMYFSQLTLGKKNACGPCSHGACPYNIGIECYERTANKCAKCGWSPDEETKRKRRITYELKNECRA